MSGAQIDRLCQDWLRENYGEGIPFKCVSYSLGKEIVGISGELRLI